MRSQASIKRRRRYAARWNKEHPERHRASAHRHTYTYPHRQLVRLAQARARIKGLAFDLTLEWANAKWTGYCELTGVEFDRPTGLGKTGPRPRSASIDRIDPAQGYVQTNCRFILHAINALRGAGTDAQMYQLAEQLLCHRKS